MSNNAKIFFLLPIAINNTIEIKITLDLTWKALIGEKRRTVAQNFHFQRIMGLQYFSH